MESVADVVPIREVVAEVVADVVPTREVVAEVVVGLGDNGDVEEWPEELHHRVALRVFQTAVHARQELLPCPEGGCPGNMKHRVCQTSGL